MTHELMKLPYEHNALEPYVSAETIEYHYGKHHATYVKKLNGLLEGTGSESMGLEDLITKGLKDAPAEKQTGLFNNAAQVYNHNQYWLSLTPNATKTPTGNMAEAINKKFGRFEKFQEEFTQKAVTTFGSGWAWLVKNQQGGIEIVTTSNAATPITDGKIPLIACDVWEHAYYIDYRNARPKYLEAYWNLVNWDYAEKRLG